MSFINVKIPLKFVTATDFYRLLSLKPLEAYENGKPTGVQIGYKAEVVEMTTFEKFIVKIENKLPNVTPEILAASREPVFVKFANAYAKPYVFNGRIAYSMTATNLEMHTVERK